MSIKNDYVLSLDTEEGKHDKIIVAKLRIYVSTDEANIASGNGLSPEWRQAIV